MIRKSIFVGFLQVFFLVFIAIITLLYSIDCPSGSFSCDNRTKCIIQKSVCNNIIDCSDKSDEGPLNCGIWYGSMSIVDDSVSDALLYNKSEYESQYNQNSTDLCMLPNYPHTNFLCNRLLLDCKSCGLKQLPKDLPEAVEQLILSNNKIILSNDTFKNYRNLKFIFLRNNSLNNLPIELLKYQTKLKKLYLNENQLSSIPRDFFLTNDQVEWLFLEFNNFQYINLTTFVLIPNLKWLELQHNFLTLTDQEFPKLENLTELDISHNRLREISVHLLKNLPNLERLWLGHNHIEYIHKNAFRNLVNMRDMKLSYNPIRLIDPMFSMMKLDALYLDYTDITIAKQVLVNVNVSYLNLEGIKTNKIDFDVLNQMKNLQYIVYDNIYDCFMTPKIYRCKPNNDGISSLNHLLQKPVLRYSAWIITLLICFGNAFVLWGRSVLKAENRAVSIVIRNLAVSDILMGFYLAIICIQDYQSSNNYKIVAHSWMTSKVCILAGIFAMISSETSIFILAFMSIERFLLISNPFGQHRLTYKNVKKCMFTVWIIGIKLAVIPAIRLKSSSAFYGHNSGICFPLLITDPYFIGWEYSAIIFLGINSSLFLLITVLYSALLINIFKTRMATQSLKYDYEFVIRFFFIVITDALCWGPITILKASSYFFNYKFSAEVQAWIVVFILPLNSAVNPMLYTFTTTKYREQIFSTRKLSKESEKNMKTRESNIDESFGKVINSAH